MIKLGVNIDHVATLRQARLAKEPNLARAAILAEMAGAEGITIHLREDRRHIQDRDVFVIREAISTRLNLEMSTAEDIIELALKVKPDMVTLVPEKRQELTTEGGLNVLDPEVNKTVRRAIERFKEKGIPVSLFIDPNEAVIKESKVLGAEFIEIHTGKYADALTKEERRKEFEAIEKGVKCAKEAGLGVNAGHGLNYENVYDIARLVDIEELNIGHSIVAKSVFTGFEKAVSEMKEIMVKARRDALNGKI